MLMDWNQVLITFITAIVPAGFSYFVARQQGKTDIKKLEESNKAEIDKLIKQHEIDINALKEKHKLDMEAKDKEHQYKLELMQKEFELKSKETQQVKSNDVLMGIMGGFMTDLLSDPANAGKKMEDLKKMSEDLKKSQQ